MSRKNPKSPARQRQLENELAETRQRIREIEALPLEEIDSGQLGWLQNHEENLKTSIAGTRKSSPVDMYEIIQ